MDSVVICNAVNRNGGAPTINNFYFLVKRDPLNQSEQGWVVKAPGGYEFWYGRDLLLGQRIEATWRRRPTRMPASWGADITVTSVPSPQWERINVVLLNQLILIRENLEKRRNELFSIASSGAHLGSARSWMQSKCRNGDRVKWGSLEKLEREFTVFDVEDVARTAARATVEEINSQLLSSFRNLLKTDPENMSFHITVDSKALQTRYEEEKLRARSRRST